MLVIVSLLGVGLCLLTIGGELLVRGAVSLAERLGVSPLVIGLTLVGFGTSIPELVTSVQAALAGSPGIAVGNVIGSNIANILLILGLTALIGTISVSSAAFLRDGAMLALMTLLCIGAVMLGELDRPLGVFFVCTLLIYVLVTYWRERRGGSASAELHAAEGVTAPHLRGSRFTMLAVFVTGLALTMIGAAALVEGAIGLARQLGISETIIGLTLVAVGTSLPELVTSIAAARSGHSDVALGNLIGSNIYNIAAILGVTAIIEPIVVPARIVILDVWIMLGATLALFAAVLTGWRITRLEGAVLLSLYVGYIAYLVLGAS